MISASVMWRLEPTLFVKNEQFHVRHINVTAKDIVLPMDCAISFAVRFSERMEG